MVHNTKKKALYEVIGRAGSKSGYEQLHPNGTAGENPSANPETSPNAVRWVRKSGFVQFNEIRKSTRLNSSHSGESRMPSSA